MKIFTVVIIAVVSILPSYSNASPQDDLKKFRQYYKKKFPSVQFSDYQNGIYALDKNRRETWEGFEDFAPAYEKAVKLGKKLFRTPFANGRTYASCFKNDGVGIKQNYPYFDSRKGKVKTLEMEINECRAMNGEKRLKYAKGSLAAISAYMSYTSRGKTIDVKIPNDRRARKIYEKGKRFFYAKRGQLNFSCADCHVYNAGVSVRTDLMGPGLGQVTHFPVWRQKWAAKGGGDVTVGLGTLHRRYAGCNKNIRAKPLKPQSDGYVALEYFHSYMSNGLKINGPSIRQ